MLLARVLTRVMVGAGMLALGYYVGREIGRAEPLRRHQEARRPPPPGESAPDQPASERRSEG